ncbi:MAG: hypothetical protein R3F29_11045 [Planctomycetota bacterium]
MLRETEHRQGVGIIGSRTIRSQGPSGPFAPGSMPAMETRAIVGVVFGAIVCAGAPGQERAPAQAPAAGLYQLVLTEWRACKAKGVQLPVQAQSVRSVLGRIESSQEDDDAAETAWRAIAEPTAVVRDLLAQAAAAPIGEWRVPSGHSGVDAASDLDDLATLVEGLARRALEQQSDAAAWTSLMLLRHSRHLQATASGAFVAAGHTAARRATSLLQAALPKIPDDDAHAALRARCIDEIDQFLNGDLDPHLVRKAMLDGIPARLEVHRSRLRDMHQTTPGGYDDERMRAAIEHELTLVLDECDRRHQTTGRPWRMELHELARAPRARDQADVTTLAARGMVDLALHSLDGSSRAETAYQATLLSCRDTLATTGRRQASESR